MAAYDLEEQEQLDTIKTWWKMYGNLVTLTVTLAALMVLAWQGWNWWQNKQAVQASNIYGGVQLAVSQKDAKRARELAGELIDQYGRTTYAGLAALLSAKALVDSGDTKSAQAQLTWAADNARDNSLKEIARLRLATVLLDEKSYDEALKRLTPDPAPSLQARYSEVRGDILLAQGKRPEAKAAYEAGLKQLEASTKLANNNEARGHATYREVLQNKLDMVGGAP